MKKSVVLCILDGWGIGKSSSDNAITESGIQFWNHILTNYPNSELKTSSCDVGLPKGQMGNSEVGHSNIGSGRILLQDLQKINKNIKNIEQNIDFLEFVRKVQKRNGVFHIAGLLSDGGVHSHQNHMFHLIEVLAKFNLSVLVHCFLDGRDTPPYSAANYMKELKKVLANNYNTSLATITGRYYAMDRDNKLDRTERAYKAMAFAIGEKFDDPFAFIKEKYDSGITDEFIEPSVTKNYQGMSNNDGFILVNFRSDRVLQLLKMMTNEIPIKDFKCVDLSAILGMVNYSDSIKIPSLFSSENIINTLGEVISNSGLNQLRIAETEKYAHITFFFNGGREEPFHNEERILVKSPLVSTYDLLPEMSAYQLTDEVVQNISKKHYELIVINYANADMVGHTGNFEATKKAVQTIDKCLERLLHAAQESDYVLIITSDHGNAEKMFDIGNKMPHTAHTVNNVPFVILNWNENFTLKDGRLCDIAPTILQILELKKPKEMSGESLII